MRKKILFAGVITILLLTLCSVVTYAQGQSTEASVSGISIYTYPSKTVYGAFEKLDTTGLSVRVSYTDGSERIVSGGEVIVSYTRDNCLRVGDDSALISYGGKSLRLPVTVNRISYDLDQMTLEGFSVSYNGMQQGYTKLIPQIVGLDGIPLRINATGGGINVGEYDITVDFYTDSKDYLTPESRVIRMTIEPLAADMVWEGLSFVYDGKSKSPIAYYTDVNGAKVYPTVSGAATNAGAGYIAKATAYDPNYSFGNTTVTYEIEKADYDFSCVVWSKDSFTYDGGAKSISASGLPSGVTIIGYSGDRATDAGSYIVTAMLKWDENNYNTPAALTHVWEIKKADYDMSSVSFRSEIFVYDGKMHYPTLLGNMPVGADGIMLEYSFSAGACHVADGTVSVTVSFYSTSANYNIPGDRHSSVSINPCATRVEWGELSLPYIGEEQLPTAYSSDCIVIVSGAGVDTGKYIATASTDNSDYYVSNDRIEYSIVKAQNYWTTLPTDSVCYEGRDIILTAESRFGETEYKFYSDPECLNEIPAPVDLGIYYAIVHVADTVNYSALKSEPISFEIVKVLPISFLAVITKEAICAFDTLTEGDILCSVLNNDGSVTEVDPSLVNIVYENGSCFARTDKGVILSYDKYTITLPIEVGYANYDMSSVQWINTTQVYDGNEKQPSLEGLPEGVRVVEYIGCNNVNAGSYTVYAVFDYDKENYNQPELSPCELVIEKCMVTVPQFTLVYNGEGQIPVSLSDLYTVKVDREYTDCGSYTVIVSLSDPTNYSFQDGSGQLANAVLQITPATIAVKVEDMKLKIFEKAANAEYIITDGEIFNGDTLTVSTYVEKRKVYIRSENPNYRLEVTPGRIIRLPYPTVGGAFVILGIMLMMLAMALGAMKIYREREQIATAAAIMRCKWHNRNYKAPKPRNLGVDNIISTKPSAKDTDRLEMPDAAEDSIPLHNSSISVDIDATVNRLYNDMDAERADTLITDSLAKSLVHREGEIVYTDGNDRCIVNIGDISPCFKPGDKVDVNSLKRKGIITQNIAYIKILGGGKIDKPLTVCANDFSFSAIKMIALMGGQSIKIVTFKRKSDDEKG